MMDFNSIKVQLKRGCVNHEETHAVFQFHKGTIKTGRMVVQTSKLPNFNSIKVQLKPKTPVNNSAISAFQFHKGTIKTTFSHYVMLIILISIP